MQDKRTNLILILLLFISKQAFANDSNINLFEILVDAMNYNQERQMLITQNISAANVPGYVGKDLKPFSLNKSKKNIGKIKLAATSSKHISGSSSNNKSYVDVKQQITFNKNTINADEELFKASVNMQDYQTTANVYKKMINLYKSAISGGGK